MPLVSVVSEMEMVGFRVDRRRLFELKIQAEKAVAEAQKKFNDLIGYEVNIGSDQQVASALFDPEIGLGFDTTEVPVGKSGVYSVSTTVLSRFDHPAVSLILQYRASKKLLSTYILPLLERSFGSRGAMIKARWNQTGTETGRFSSSSPNMQNFPRGDDSIRGAILPPRDDMVCVACDLSQSQSDST
jgi:DNA polymerase-1